MVRNRRTQGAESGIGQAESMAQNRSFKGGVTPEEAKSRVGEVFTEDE